VKTFHLKLEKRSDFILTLTFAMAAAWLRSTPWPLLPAVEVGGGPEDGKTLLLVAADDNEDVEVADAVTEESGRSELSVVGNGNEDDDPLCAYNKKRSF
jgi:hypothetical protein